MLSPISSTWQTPNAKGSCDKAANEDQHASKRGAIEKRGAHETIRLDFMAAGAGWACERGIEKRGVFAVHILPRATPVEGAEPHKRPGHKGSGAFL